MLLLPRTGVEIKLGKDREYLGFSGLSRRVPEADLGAPNIRLVLKAPSYYRARDHCTHTQRWRRRWSRPLKEQAQHLKATVVTEELLTAIMLGTPQGSPSHRHPPAGERLLPCSCYCEGRHHGVQVQQYLVPFPTKAMDSHWLVEEVAPEKPVVGGKY